MADVDPKVANATEPAKEAPKEAPKEVPKETAKEASSDVPESEEVPIVIRVAPPAKDNESEDEEEAAPKQVRLPRRLAGVCDETTWRKFVPAVFEKVVGVARRVVGDDEFDVVPFVRAAIEGMSFSSESARFSTLGMDVGVPGATPQCIDLLGGLARVSAARAVQNGEYAAHFATAAALQTHLMESGARVCALPFVESWMVIAAASARQGVWAPLRLKRKAAAEDDIDGEALAAMARALDGPQTEEVEAAPRLSSSTTARSARRASEPLRAGRKKRKRDEE